MKNILSSYNAGWKCFLLNWRIVLFIFLVNIVMAFLALRPLTVALEDAFGTRGLLGTVISDFDYALVSDFTRLYGLQISTFTAQLLPLFGIYMILYFFIYGGLSKAASLRLERIGMQSFFNAGSKYFLKMTILGILVLISYSIVGYLLYQFFAIEGFNPLELESETGIIRRFWISMGLFAIAGFFIATIRDFTRLFIVDEEPGNILKSLSKGVKLSLKPANLFLSLLNVMVLISLIILYQWIKTRIGNFTLLTIIVGQLLIVFRIAYKLIRLASFNAIQNKNS